MSNTGKTQDSGNNVGNSQVSNESELKHVPADSLFSNTIRAQKFQERELEKMSLQLQQQKRIFDWTLDFIMKLYIFAMGVVVFVLFTVACQGSGWVIVLGTASLIVPTFLVTILIIYAYRNTGKDTGESLQSLLSMLPGTELAKKFLDVLADACKKKA